MVSDGQIRLSELDDLSIDDVDKQAIYQEAVDDALWRLKKRTEPPKR